MIRSLHFLCIAWITFACSQQQVVRAELSLEEVGEGRTRFAFSLYENLREEEGNIVVSPYSVTTAMAMVYAGAVGETADQIKTVLHFPPAPLKVYPALCQDRQDLLIPSEKGYELYLADRLWVQKNAPLRPSFLRVTTQEGDAGVETLDFAAAPDRSRLVINKWVEGQTRGHIQGLLPENAIEHLTRMVLTSALYCKAAWHLPFDPNVTEEDRFYASTGKVETVPMMQQVGNFPLFVHDSFALLELPYRSGQEQGELVLYLLLPHPHQALSDVEEQWDAVSFSAWRSKMNVSRVDLRLPRFKISYDLVLKQILQKMGLALPFSNAADFSSINGEHDLKLGNVFHKAMLSIDEQGIEAAAATGAVMNVKALYHPKPPYAFHVNRPFAFVLFHQDTQSLLFMGRVQGVQL